MRVQRRTDLLAGFCASAVLAAFLGSPAAAQLPHPNLARGFSADGSFSKLDLDSVNLQNGNLTLAIPIGQRYPVTSAFSYGLTLYYNSSVWKRTRRTNCPPDNIPCVIADPDPEFNAGLGWKLSLGNLYSPGQTGNDTGRWLYVGPDGSRHIFFSTLHEDEAAAGGYYYTRDNSYLRLDSSTRSIEFPDGTVHKFDSASSNLKSVRDKFSAVDDVAVSSIGNPWTITDRHLRTHRIYFSTLSNPATTYVDRVEVATFGTGAASTTTYQFAYEDATSIFRPKEHTFEGGSATVNVRFLKSIVVSNGGGNFPQQTYSMREENDTLGYAVGDATLTSPTGMLQTLKLPTNGRISWNYGEWAFPVPNPLVWLSRIDGVRERETTVPGGTGGIWRYKPMVFPSGNPNELITEVREPEGNYSIHYFTMPKTYSSSTWSGWEYGLPYTTRATFNGRYLSTVRSLSPLNEEENTGFVDPERSVWVSYAHDKLQAISSANDLGLWYASNRRLNGSITKFDDDGAGRFTGSSLSLFDGLGHYRLNTLSGHFDADVFRTERVQFNGDGCYEFVPPNGVAGCTASGGQYEPPTGPWLLEDFSYATQSEGGAAIKQLADFDATTGRLKCLRLLKSTTPNVQGDVAETSEDVAIEFGVDGEGNTTFAKFRGGDNAQLAVGGACAPTGNPNYWIENTYSTGAVATSKYKRPNGQSMGFLSYDATIDRNTGLASELRDSSNFLTRLTYDGLGRPLSVSPMGVTGPATHASRGALTAYNYVNASTTAAAKVEIKETYCANGLPGCTGPEFSAVELHFDGLGRQIREWVRLQSGDNWGRKEAAFSASGWLTSISEYGPNAQGGNTELQQHDVYGRPGRIVTPDLKIINLGYSGARETSRTMRVYSIAGSPETSTTTTEVYDAFGRLYQVKEPAESDGSNTVTTYLYDVGNRVKWVSQQTDAGTQGRYFDFDGRGFLAQERHPEKGWTGNGNMFYSKYDARGHPRRATDGAGAWDRLFTYDPAERLLTVAESSPPSRILKEFVYDGLGGNSLGRLDKATRHNYILGTDYKVTESYSYDGVGRLPSDRKTQTNIFGDDEERFDQTWAYDRAGHVLSQTYPQCFGGTCPATGTAPRTQGYTYTRSYLTGVTGFASSIGYYSNGMLNALAMSNGISQLVYVDTNTYLPRPTEIRYVLTADNNVVRGTTGAYAYDSSGNIKTLDGKDFLYDSVSRVKSGTVTVNGVPRTQSYTYDGFGNLQSITNALARDTPTDPLTNRVSSATYNAGGNMTAWNGATYAYDRLNMLSEICSSGSIASCPATSEHWHYAYTADDERILEYRVGGGAWRTSIRDLSGKILREYRLEAGSNWSVFEDYIYRGQTLLASISPTDGTRYFGTDHLGTPRFTFASSAGALVATHTYYPYGQEATTGAGDTQQLKFTGHERDSLSTSGTDDDTDYMHARQFSLQLGRFMSADPVLGNPRFPQSWNLFAYALGNPLKYVDPTGRCAQWIPIKDDKGNEVGATCLDGIDVLGGKGQGPDTANHGDRRKPPHENDRELRSRCEELESMLPAGYDIGTTVSAVRGQRYGATIIGAVNPLAGALLRAASIASLGAFLLSDAGGNFKGRPDLEQRQLQIYARAGNYNAGALFAAADLPFPPLVIAGGFLEVAHAFSDGDFTDIGSASTFFEDRLDISDARAGFDCY